MTDAIDSALRRAMEAASAAITDPRRWHDCIQGLGQATNAAGASIFRVGPSPSIGPLAVEGTQAAGTRAYWEHWVHQDPWNRAAIGTELFQRAGEVRLGSEFLSDDAYRRSAYYDGHGRQVDSGHKLFLKVCDAFDPVAPITHVTLSRSFRQAPFGAAEKSAVRRLWPHLHRAVQAHAVLQKVGQVGHVAEASLEQVPLPALVIRADRRIDFANQAASALLVAERWFGMRAGRLTEIGNLDESELRALIERTARGVNGERLISYQRHQSDDLARATIRFVPLAESSLYAAAWPHAAALLMIEARGTHDDADWIRDHLAPHFHLTPTECRVLELLTAGRTVISIALALGIGDVTVRTHLRALRDKTGRRSQIELVRLGLGR